MKIKDLTTGEVFEYGSDHHHALRISSDGTCLYFEHLQNGDGSFYGDYRFVDDSEEQIPDNRDPRNYDSDSYFNIGGFGTAYDTDKIVERLKAKSERIADEVEEIYHSGKIFTEEGGRYFVERVFTDAIEIEKGGAV